ncbi:MAG: DUF2127 domain-containing protein [Terracidiphilus sp.]|jgi:uncharacterized membrane protein (DUF2068 family)
MNDHPSQSLSKPPQRNQWLILIAAFKFVQALLFVAVGVGAFRLLHKDAGDELTKIAEHLRFNPESHFVNLILKYAPLVNDRMLMRIGAVVFIYAGLDLIEGTGLYLEKAWAEWFTLAITASFLPLEIFEVMRRVTPMRVSLLLINALVVVYLLKLVIDRRRWKKQLSANKKQ